MTIAVALALAGCAHPPDLDSRQYEALLRQSARSLQAHQDADSLAAAALFSVRGDPGAAAELMTRAGSAGPGRPELTILHAWICARAPECDMRPIEARLRAQEPENGISWLGAVRRAEATADDAELDKALAALAGATQARSYWTRLVVRLGEAARRAAVPAGPDAQAAVAGELAVVGLPDISVVSRGCASDRLTRDGVRESCRRIAATMLTGDTVLVEMIGAAIAMRVWPEGAAEHEAAREARRVYRYRSEVLSRALQAEGDEESIAREFAELAGLHEREQDLLVAQLERRGIDPMPADDWRDERPGSRAVQ
ncbi:MAG: hypothetical protein KF822_11905 [Steroidobacteraceae bacterium]|nr:hypothetical protein [Steroidobacteraceae bacterium]